MNLETLLCRLDANHQDFRQAGGTARSWITSPEAAGSLSGLSDLTYYTVMVLCAGDEGFRAHLYAALLDHIREDGGISIQPEHGLSIVRTVVGVMTSRQKCSHCDGRGQVTKDERAEFCQICEGTGRRMTTAGMANAAEIPRHTWRKLGYTHIARMLAARLKSHIALANDHVMRQTSEWEYYDAEWATTA